MEIDSGKRGAERFSPSGMWPENIAITGPGSASSNQEALACFALRTRRALRRIDARSPKPAPASSARAYQDPASSMLPSSSAASPNVASFQMSGDEDSLIAPRHCFRTLAASSADVRASPDASATVAALIPDQYPPADRYASE